MVIRYDKKEFYIFRKLTIVFVLKNTGENQHYIRTGNDISLYRRGTTHNGQQTTIMINYQKTQNIWTKTTITMEYSLSARNTLIAIFDYNQYYIYIDSQVELVVDSSPSWPKSRTITE